MQKVVVDANVFVSMVLGGQISSAIPHYLHHDRFLLIFSPILFAELEFVLSRSKFGLTKEDISGITTFLLAKSIFVIPDEKVTVCRDPKDNPVLECAWAGRADAIVTGDKDLLLLNPFRGIPILTPRQFLEKLSSRDH
jgi:putative PIN family toxin of toxin-antitoxin system